MAVKINSPDNIQSAKLAIIETLASNPHADIIDCMLAAAKYVNTMERSVRILLRKHIVENGGSLEPPYDRIVNKIFGKYPDKTVNYLARRSVPEEAMRFCDIPVANPYAIEGPNVRLCRFPVRMFGYTIPSEGIFCCRPVPDNHDGTIKWYCREHAYGTNGAVQPDSKMKGKPRVVPPASRSNRAMRRAKNQGRNFLDSC